MALQVELSTVIIQLQLFLKVIPIENLPHYQTAIRFSGAKYIPSPF